MIKKYFLPIIVYQLINNLELLVNFSKNSEGKKKFENFPILEIVSFILSLIVVMVYKPLKKKFV
jgi:hypothetical protein